MRIFGRVTVVALLLGVGLLAGVPASADTGVGRAVSAWKADGPGVYLDAKAVGNPLSRTQAARLGRVVANLDTPMYVAALGEPSSEVARVDLRELIDRFHRHGTYVVVGDGGFLAASDVPGVEGATESLAQEATSAHPGQPTRQLTEFARLVDAAASSGGSDDGAVPGTVPGSGVGDQDGDSSSAWVPWVVVGAIGVGGLFLWRRRRAAVSAAIAAQFAEVRQAADEDVTALGEELTALEVPPASQPDAAADYAAALDAYEQAKALLAQSRRPDDVRAVTNALEDGRWRLTCVRARLAGNPVPERRPPCFFNPRHGPSVDDVEWAPAGGAPRSVPVCAADAARLARGEDPDSRMVSVAGGTVPYWRGPAYFGPYAGGFFGGWGGPAFLGGLLLGEMLATPAYSSVPYDAGAGGDGSFGGGSDDFGGDSGDSGDFAGGFDVGGGGDWGGGDFGGGDFGGGDW